MNRTDMSFNPAERIRRGVVLTRTRLLRYLAAMFQEWSGACQRAAERPLSGGTPSMAGETNRARTKPAWALMLRNWSHPATLEMLLSRGLIGDDLPRQFDLPAGRRILVLAAHQDDEIIGAGGTFLLCAREGRAFKVIYYTDGATSVAGMPPDEVSRWRHAEARNVWRRLAGVEPTFWDYPNRSGQLAADAAPRLKQAIDEFRPDVIFVPSFFEQPTDHRRLNDLLLQANLLQTLPPHVEIWAYQITTRLPGNRAVDITAVWKKKYALNRLWASQNVYMNYAHLAMGRDIANAYYLKGRRNIRRAASYAELFLVFDSTQYLAFAAALRPRTTAPADGSCPPPDFLVVGLQKSGTYWVTALLDAHADIRCFPSRPGHADGSGEAHFFDLLARMDRHFPSFHRSMRKKLGGQFASVLPPQAPRSEALRQELRLRLRDRFNEYCFAQRVDAGKRLVGEKTTETILHPELVEQLYPGIRKVCIVRDPRDRAVSFFYHQQRKAKTAREAVMTAADARAYVARVRQDYEGLLRMPDPVHVLTYEQLCASPQREVKSLLEFLGADASAEAIERTLKASSFHALAGREPGEENVLSHFRQGLPGNWSRHFDDAVALEMTQALEDLTRQVESRFGLDLSSYRVVATDSTVPAR